LSPRKELLCSHHGCKAVEIRVVVRGDDIHTGILAGSFDV